MTFMAQACVVLFFVVWLAALAVWPMMAWRMRRAKQELREYLGRVAGSTAPCPQCWAASREGQRDG